MLHITCTQSFTAEMHKEILKHPRVPWSLRLPELSAIPSPCGNDGVQPFQRTLPHAVLRDLRLGVDMERKIGAPNIKRNHCPESVPGILWDYILSKS